MNKRDILIIALLFALWMAWPWIDRGVIKKYFPAKPAPAAPAAEAAPAVAAPETVVAEPAKAAAQPVARPAAEPASAPAAEPEEQLAGTTAVIENGDMKVTLFSRGATVMAAEFKNKAYRRTLDPDSGPVVLDFSGARALAYANLPGLSAQDDFDLQAAPDGRSATFQRRSDSGLVLRRTISVADGYMLKVDDEFFNEGAKALAVAAHSIQVGSMSNLVGDAGTRGVFTLGVDSLSPGGEGVKHWGSKIGRWFDQVRKEKGLTTLPASIEWPLERPADWVAAKNKYFAQVLIPEGGAERVGVRAARVVSDAEREDPKASPKSAAVAQVRALMYFAEAALGPGEKLSRPMQYYLGPKKYSELNQYGLHVVDVMEFGMWAPIGKLLLVVMNGIHKYIWPHNYGIAIILLTILVRILFWPVTHKSTESMKKMQAIQPEVNALRQKYKDNPQKQQQEIMALYKEHKVNPLGGCLPTLIQIPVFIALFVVLRSAIELRFARFLWIKDLSQPENLLAGVLPIPLNILPLFMAVTMAWQQKLTPGAGTDPNQKTMMMIMPVMMLFLFYNFAAGLVLYWSTNQVLMIAQQLMMQKKKAKA